MTAVFDLVGNEAAIRKRSSSTSSSTGMTASRRRALLIWVCYRVIRISFSLLTGSGMDTDGSSRIQSVSYSTDIGEPSSEFVLANWNVNGRCHHLDSDNSGIVCTWSGAIENIVITNDDINCLMSKVVPSQHSAIGTAPNRYVPVEENPKSQSEQPEAGTSDPDWGISSNRTGARIDACDNDFHTRETGI